MPKEVSYIWIGQFTDEAPEDFFEEKYGRDDEPLSQFANSQGQSWYDHDFVEISYLDSLEPIASLIDGHSYFDQYQTALLHVTQAKKIVEANVFVLASKDQFSSPRTASGIGYDLWFMGSFSYDI
jgi:hypothetical protein